MTDQPLPANDGIYDLFAKTIREPGRHTALLTRIRGVVDDVCALREAYEPTLLQETTYADAQQMIDSVTELQVLVREIVEK